ncbi:unnamed protein product, partial [Musa acuminata var. zebrina]
MMRETPSSPALFPPLPVAYPMHPSVPAVVSSLVASTARGKAPEKRVPDPTAGALSWSQGKRQKGEKMMD